jgi:hypothetical protein
MKFRQLARSWGAKHPNGKIHQNSKHNNSMFINFLQQKRKCPKTKKIAQNIESGIFETLKNNSLVELEKNIYLNSIVEEGTSSKDMNYRMIAKVMCKVGFG